MSCWFCGHWDNRHAPWCLVPRGPWLLFLAVAGCAPPAPTPPAHYLCTPAVIHQARRPALYCQPVMPEREDPK